MNEEHKGCGGIAPAFVNGKQAAAMLGISERKLHELRAEGLAPQPMALGPRALRWSVAELIEHIRANAPRGPLPEPAHLRAVREASKGGA